MFSRPCKEHEAAPLATYMKVYQKGDVDIKGMGTAQKGMPTARCYHGKTGRVYKFCGGHCCAQTRARFLPGELVHILIASYQCMKESDQKKKEAKEKGT